MDVSYLVLLCIILVIIYRIYKAIKTQRFYDSEGMPGEIVSSSLLASEKSLSISTPIKIHGTPDQVYLTEDKKVIVVDTKNRNNGRIYDKDILQLSLYSLMLKKKYTRYEMESNYAYMRLVSNNTVKYKKVSLYDEEKLITLYNHYHDLIEGNVQAIKTSYLPCQSCHYKSPCRIKN